jgi:SAM-dependent methyltransferase
LRGNDIVCVICRDCTHLFLNPRPPMDAFKAFYEGESYFELCANFSDVSLGQKMDQFNDESFWQSRFVHGEQLHKLYLEGELGPGDLVFDFGCGDGAWLWALQELTGCRVGGEEISEVYADVVRKRLGIDVFVGPIEELADEIVEKHAGEAKLAIVSGSLQHMLRPMQCLEAARGILRDDGYLFVCNWNIFEHYMTPYEDDTQRLLGEVLSWEHPHYFHESSYRYMLARAGFEVVAFNLESPVRPRHMEALARKGATADAAVPTHTTADVVSRLRALESSTIAERLRRIG